MLNKKFWEDIFKKQDDFNVSRRKIISESLGSLHLAKQSIFALQRDNKTEAKEKMDLSKSGLMSLDKRFGKNVRLRMEGSWKAAVEEYLEAKMFSDFMSGKKIEGVKEFSVEADEYIGALSDVSGEVVRMMIIWTTKNKIPKVKKAGQAVSDIINELMKNNFSGYLRTKFDQAKRNLQKSEGILYDISIRDK